jgi:hypothetical protein
MLYIVQYELSTYTRITVNYNVSDTDLASVLAQVASPADNFTSNDKSLYNKVQNALLQGKHDEKHEIFIFQQHVKVKTTM